MNYFHDEDVCNAQPLVGEGRVRGVVDCIVTAKRLFARERG